MIRPNFPSSRSIPRMLQSLWFWAGLLILVSLVSLLCGASWMSLPQMIRSLQDPGSTGYAILVHVRLPRLLGGMICGGALAVAGYLLQSLLNNPLAAPHSMGLQSGAGFVQALAGLVCPAALSLGVPAAFIGCLLAGLLIVGLARTARVSRSTLILAGLAISQIFSAGIDLIITLDSNALMGYAAFKVGSLSGLTLQELGLPALLVGAGWIVALLCSQELDLLSLGTPTAQSLGLNIQRWTRLFMLLVCLLSACVVQLAGLIGFVGLIVPHLVKQTLPKNTPLQLTGCILQGAGLVCSCDVLARLVFAPFEIPTGIVLSLLGGPYFLYLLLSMRRRPS